MSFGSPFGQLKVDNAILDGELVCLDSHGHSQFYELLYRHAQPVYAFDLVWLNGKDLRELPLLERKEHLQELITKSNGPDIINAQFVEGSGTALFNEICERNLEGIVCKIKSSVYSKIRRAWLKVKNRNYTQAKDRQDSTQAGNARSRDGGKHDDYPQSYIDPKGYWIDPERNIRRMGDEGSEQQIIAKATEECSDAEWNRICDALKVSLFKMD